MSEQTSKSLEEILKDKGLSKAQFSRLMNTSAQNVQNWINRGVPAIKALEVSSKLQVPIDSLIKVGDEWKGVEIQEPTRSYLSIKEKEPRKVSTAREAMLEIIETGLLKDLTPTEFRKLIDLLESLPSQSEGREGDQ